MRMVAQLISRRVDNGTVSPQNGLQALHRKCRDPSHNWEIVATSRSDPLSHRNMLKVPRKKHLYFLSLRVVNSPLHVGFRAVPWNNGCLQTSRRWHIRLGHRGFTWNIVTNKDIKPMHYG